LIRRRLEVGVADPVAELNPLDDLWQSILTVELAPFLLRGHHQLEGHGQSGFAAQASFGAFRSMPAALGIITRRTGDGM